VASGTIQAAADALGLSHSTAQDRLASLRGDEPMVSALRSVRTYRRRTSGGHGPGGTPMYSHGYVFLQTS
jgi:hypothetical protein